MAVTVCVPLGPSRQLVAVARRVPGHVVGDGTRTIEQLVEEVNRDPRRGIGHEKVLTRLVFDHQADTMLARKGYTRETVPEAGERVFLRSTGNLSTGGTATDMTDTVHPDNAEMAVRAVKAIGLDVGGVVVGDVPSFRMDNMPYGGIKDSGLGREGVKFAIEDMSEMRLLVLKT